MSVRTARTWQRGRLPSEKNGKRRWRTRPLSLSESIPRIGTGKTREMALSPSTTSDCSRGADRPFAEVWAEEVEPLLRSDVEGALKATTILEWLEERHPARFSVSQLRTLRAASSSRLACAVRAGPRGVLRAGASPWSRGADGLHTLRRVGGDGRREPFGEGDDIWTRRAVPLVARRRWTSHTAASWG